MGLTRVLTAEEITARNECLARGEQWPPVEEHKKLQERAAKLEERLKVVKGKRLDKILTLNEILERHGIEPAEELIMMATQTLSDGTYALSADQRIKIFTELLQYRMPKLKAIEVSGKVDHQLTVIIKKFGDIEEGPARVFDISTAKRIGGGE